MQHLLNSDAIQNWILKDEKFHRSHGAHDNNLGTGMLYYALTYCYQAKLAVCLGSGSGFVPRLMRMAQNDLGIAAASETVLVDANLPEAGWGSPDYFSPCFFTESFDVRIVQKKTADAVSEFTDIDYLHIDADHSYEGSKSDLMEYSKKLSKKAVITMHDTIPRKAGVWKVIEEAREDFDVVDLPLNMGVAILTRKNNA